MATGRGAAFVNGQFVGGKAWTAVNGAYTRWGVFTPGWYGRYPGCWWPGKWAIATTAWATLGWATCGGYCGCSGDGDYYDYGGNVTYQEGNVYYGDQPVATAEQYYDQAEQLADAGKEAQNEEWLPLGVYAVIAEPTQTQTDKVLQLAVNKDGVIRGNFQDSLTDKVMPVIGSVDKQTQRVCFKPEGNGSLVVETGLYDLTNDEVPVLVHFGADRQELRTLIRLKQPEEQSQPAAETGAASGRASAADAVVVVAYPCPNFASKTSRSSTPRGPNRWRCSAACRWRSIRARTWRSSAPAVRARARS